MLGNSLIRYGREVLFYLSARRCCMETFKANLVEFRNEQEWNDKYSFENYIPDLDDSSEVNATNPGGETLPSNDDSNLDVEMNEPK